MRLFLLTAATFMVLATTAHAQLAGWTNLLQHPVQGSQIMYFGPSGKAYLWSLRSAEIEVGRYYSGMMENTTCFKFGPDRYNPVTGLPAGRSECTPRPQFANLVTEQARGDVFNLAGRRDAPFALGGSRLTLAQAARRAGIQLANPVITKEDLIVRPGERVTADQICRLYPDLKDYEYSPCAE
jgi:hypothetical protein